MKKIEFKVDIKTSAQKVYETMLGLQNIATYEGWTAIFNPTSTYIGNWKKDEKMLFFGTDEQGKKGGMVSTIVENIPAKFVSIKHLGIVDGDTEITTGEQVESWAGGLENYSFVENNGVTTVTIEMDSNEEFMSYFSETWPKALLKLKEITES